MSSDSSFPEPLQWNGDEPDPYQGERPEQPEPSPRCDRCGGDCHWGTVTSPIGTFCGRACYDAEELEFEQRLKRQGFQRLE